MDLLSWEMCNVLFLFYPCEVLILNSQEVLTFYKGSITGSYRIESGFRAESPQLDRKLRKTWKAEYGFRYSVTMLVSSFPPFLTRKRREEVQERVQVLGEQLLGHVGRVEVALEVGVLLVDLLLEGHAVGQAARVELGQLLHREDDLLVGQLVLEPVAGGEALGSQVLYHKNLKQRNEARYDI